MNGQPDGLRSIGFRPFGVEFDLCVLSEGMVKNVFFTIATIIAITVTHHHHHSTIKHPRAQLAQLKRNPIMILSNSGSTSSIISAGGDVVGGVGGDGALPEFSEFVGATRCAPRFKGDRRQKRCHVHGMAIFYAGI